MDKTTDQDLRKDILLAVCAIGLVVSLTYLWFYFDHHFPAQDEAEHIMNSIAFRDLLASPRPFNSHWWYQCLTVNRFYPPFIYFVNGSMLLFFGQSRFIEQITICIFAGIMVLSVYALTRILSGSRLASCAAALCLAMYPTISTLSHSFYLDLPEVAMTALALTTLIWWRNNQNLKWWRTILTAFVMGIACLSKQLVAAYLLPVGLYFLFADSNVLWPKGKVRTNRLIHIFVMGCITIFIGLPFILLNYQFSRGLTESLVQDTAAKHVHISYVEKLIAYWHLLPSAMSPLLFVLFLLSLFLLWRPQYINLIPVNISAVGGLLLTCALPGFGQDYRYLAPFLITPAIYSGFFLDKLFNAERKWLRLTAGAIVILASINYLFFNFVPYPLSCPQLPWQTAISDHNGTPNSANDWGQSLVIKTIERVDGHRPVYLNVLTNLGTLHAHAFELLLKEKGNTSITPTTSRFFTVVGDKVDFSPKTALYYQWYLFKTGPTGYYFYDKQSENNFKKLVDFIQNSGNYKLMLQKNLPDNSQLMLYRKKT